MHSCFSVKDLEVHVHKSGVRGSHCFSAGCACSSRNGSHPPKPLPSDAALEEVLHKVRLGLLLKRSSSGGANVRNGDGKGLDTLADWGGILSLGEQQRLAFAR